MAQLSTHGREIGYRGVEKVKNGRVGRLHGRLDEKKQTRQA
jgi:hypothetical protein